jgi:hypothetical protein
MSTTPIGLYPSSRCWSGMVGGHADIDRAMSLVGHDVDAGAFKGAGSARTAYAEIARHTAAVHGWDAAPRLDCFAALAMTAEAPWLTPSAPTPAPALSWRPE